MIIISYDIKDDHLRNKFSKNLVKMGAIRLQMSVYEVNYSQRMMDNLLIRIHDLFSKEFSEDDSVMIFETDSSKIRKYGNAIHRDRDIIFL